MENAISFRPRVSNVFHYVANLYSTQISTDQPNSNIYCMSTLCHTRHWQSWWVSAVCMYGGYSAGRTGKGNDKHVNQKGNEEF